MSKAYTKGGGIYGGVAFPGIWIAIAVIIILLIFFAVFWWIGAGGIYGPYY